MSKLVSDAVMYRYLLFMVTLREIKIRYKQSVMGVAWALLMPMLVVASSVLVQRAASILSGRAVAMGDIASVSVKAIPWAFFVSSIRFATSSLTSNGNLISKIYFPRAVFPLSAVFAHLVDFGVAAAVVVALLGLAGMGASIQLLWVPLLLVTLVVLTAGISMFLACANVFFRDVKYIVEAILTFGIFFTPVFYEARVLGSWATLILMNPIGSILEALNDVVVLHRQPDVLWVSYAVAWAVVGCVISWKIFERAEDLFAENL